MPRQGPALLRCTPAIRPAGGWAAPCANAIAANAWTAAARGNLSVGA